MPDPYQVLGPSVPPMLGRVALMSRIDKHLRKQSPDHVSVVGPAHYGKSVLLHHAAATYRDGVEQYVTAAYVDLRRGVPASDREFMRRFAAEVKAALQGNRPDLAEYFELEFPDYDVLDLVFDQLEKDGVRLLAVLDGFDYALAGTGLTRNLWDQLRTLAQRTSLRLSPAAGGRCASCAGRRSRGPRTSGRYSTILRCAWPRSTTVIWRRSCSRSVTPAASWMSRCGRK